jgi:hypothetical protein
VAGKSVVLETDVSNADRYDRLLRYVWLTDGILWTLVNAELVRAGYASVSTYPPDVKYVDLFLEAEHSARESGRGLWATAPDTGVNPAASVEPNPNPTKKPDPSVDCHASYEPCLPIVDDLDCPDVRGLGKAPVRVVGPDAYRLDRDKDGLGCE